MVCSFYHDLSRVFDIIAGLMLFMLLKDSFFSLAVAKHHVICEQKMLKNYFNFLLEIYFRGSLLFAFVQMSSLSS